MPQHDTSKPRPNLFIVGAAKCGTTSLHRDLSLHPDVFMSDPKEPRFFARDLDLRHRWVDTEEQYMQLFSGGARKKYRGEATVFYLPSESAAREIREFNPDARIIITLRHPVDMMYSWHGQLLHLGQETEPDFSKALDLQAERRRHVPPCAPCSVSLQYQTMATFSGQVARFQEEFSRDQLHIMLFEDLVKRREYAMKQLHLFLGLEPVIPSDRGIANASASKKYRNLQIRQMLQKRSVLRSVIGRLPASFRHRIGDVAQSVFHGAIDRSSTVPDDVRQKLDTWAEGEIRQLASTIDRDLSHWLSSTSRK